MNKEARRASWLVAFFVGWDFIGFVSLTRVTVSILATISNDFSVNVVAELARDGYLDRASFVLQIAEISPYSDPNEQSDPQHQ